MSDADVCTRPKYYKLISFYRLSQYGVGIYYRPLTATVKRQRLPHSFQSQVMHQNLCNLQILHKIRHTVFNPILSPYRLLECVPSSRFYSPCSRICAILSDSNDSTLPRLYHFLHGNSTYFEVGITISYKRYCMPLYGLIRRHFQLDKNV